MLDQGRSMSVRPDYKFCIVGSGPSAFYTAKYLQREYTKCKIDMVERLPTPFGLVRYGVAPDHPEVKNVIHDFEDFVKKSHSTTTAGGSSPTTDNATATGSTVTGTGSQFRFYGNVEVGKDVSIEQLRLGYDAVILAYGCTREQKLGIKGENLKGVYSAKQFVSWYNSHPLYDNLLSPLSHISGNKSTTTSNMPPKRKVEHVVIVGAGNVSLDMARLLAANPEELLQHTDVSPTAYQALMQNRPKTVTIIARRGVVQASFTNKELRELLDLPGACSFVDPTDIEMSLQDEASKEQLEKVRSKSRSLTLFKRLAENWDPKIGPFSSKLSPYLGQNNNNNNNQTPSIVELMLKFFAVPVEIIPSSTSPGHIGAIKVAASKLDEAGKSVIDDSQEAKLIPCDLLLYSVGFKSEPIEGVSLLGNNFLPNDRGVVSPDAIEEYANGAPVYVAGWLKNGPRGTIATSLRDAQETVAAIVATLERVKPQSTCASGFLERKLAEADSPIDVVTWQDWLALDEAEKRRGAAVGKPSWKCTSVPEMMDIIHNARSLHHMQKYDS